MFITLAQHSCKFVSNRHLAKFRNEKWRFIQQSEWTLYFSFCIALSWYVLIKWIRYFADVFCYHELIKSFIYGVFTVRLISKWISQVYLLRPFPRCNVMHSFQSHLMTTVRWNFRWNLGIDETCRLKMRAHQINYNVLWFL